MKKLLLIIILFELNSCHKKDPSGVWMSFNDRIIDYNDSFVGGKEISKFQDRNWGDKVGYISDLDRHIIAFAEEKNNK